MRIKELMVGNHINNVNGFPQEVEEITEDGVVLGGAFHHISTVEGILITKEIVEQSGFRYDGVYAYKELDGTSYITFYMHEGILREFYVHKNGSQDLIFQSKPGYHYVHQLESLFNICGFDIKLNVEPTD